MSDYEDIRKRMADVYQGIRQAATVADASRKRLPVLQQQLEAAEKAEKDAIAVTQTMVEGEVVSLLLYKQRIDSLDLLHDATESARVLLWKEQQAVDRAEERRAEFRTKYLELEKDLAKSIAPVIALRE